MEDEICKLIIKGLQSLLGTLSINMALAGLEQSQTGSGPAESKSSKWLLPEVKSKQKPPSPSPPWQDGSTVQYWAPFHGSHVGQPPAWGAEGKREREELHIPRQIHKWSREEKGEVGRRVALPQLFQLMDVSLLNLSRSKGGVSLASGSIKSHSG